MEYVYAAMVLHEAGKETTEDSVTAILEAGDIDVDETRVKALVSALEDVDVEEAIAQSAAAPAPAAGGGAAAAEAEPEDDEEEEAHEEEEEAEPEDEEDEEDEDAAEGLGDLFG